MCEDRETNKDENKKKRNLDHKLVMHLRPDQCAQ